MQPRSDDDRTPATAGSTADDPHLRRRVRAGRQTDYDVRWCRSFDDAITAMGDALAGRSSMWVTTATPHREHRTAFFEPARQRLAPRAVHVLTCSERHKTLAEVERVCRWAQECDLGRSSVLVAIGGGVCSDIVTVAASLLRRGIAHVRVPTTLLGVVDAAVGAKGAVNFGARKNSLGCFHAVDSVLLAPRFLGTLPARHLRSGLAEVLKAAMAADAELFVAVERHGETLLRDPDLLTPDQQHALIWRAAIRMVDELEPDLYEQHSFVRTMDYAHTFGPLLEVAADYSLTHGEAVAIDIAFTTVLAHELGWLANPDFERIVRLMGRLGLERHHRRLDVALCEAAIRESIQHRGGQLLLWLPVGIGAVRCLTDAALLTPELLRRSLQRCGARAP